MAGRSGRARLWLSALGGLAAAAALLLLITFGQLTALRGELAQAERALATAETSSREVAAVLARPVRLAQLTGSAGTATVVQNTDGQLLVAAHLPPLAANKVYQLWLIAGTDAPVSAGVFMVDSSGSGLLTLSPGQQLAGMMLAVTSEPGPQGSPGPTSDPLISGQAAL
jgi:anti-sigma-K factor RskA